MARYGIMCWELILLEINNRLKTLGQSEWWTVVLLGDHRAYLTVPPDYFPRMDQIEKFPCQKYNITHYEKLGFSYLILW